jgi:hypothetical protein
MSKFSFRSTDRYFFQGANSNFRVIVSLSLIDISKGPPFNITVSTSSNKVFIFIKKDFNLAFM